MRRALTVIVIGLALAASGCGSGGSKDPGSAGTTGPRSPGARPNFPGIYAEALRVCSEGPIGRVARNAHTSSTKPNDVALAVARGYLPKFRSEAFKGCQAGLKLVTPPK